MFGTDIEDQKGAEMGEKLSVKEYARSRGISAEIVRRQIVRYEKELEGHLEPLGKSKLLDEEAVKFLDGHRLQKNVTIELTDTEVKREVEALKKTIEDLRGKLDEAKSSVIELQAKQIALIEEKGRFQGLLEAKEQSEKDKDREIEELRKDLSSFQKSVFGFWRKKKD